MKQLLLSLLLLAGMATGAAHAETRHQFAYNIEEAYDDKWFVINSVEFEAKGSCPEFFVGDLVTFRNGNPYGRCITATIVKPNASTRSARNWCTLYCDWADY